METKKEIRSAVLKKRRHLTEEETADKSRVISQTVTCHPWFEKADLILFYVDYNREVSTRQMIERAWEQGKRTAVPRVHGKTMDYFLITSWEDLEPGMMGIPEPKAGCPRVEPEDEAKEAVLVIMPGVAFDRERNRIGYGGGYYDRYFENRTNLKKIAVAFEVQMIPRIEAEPFDLKPDCIITEKQLYCPD